MEIKISPEEVCHLHILITYFSYKSSLLSRWKPWCYLWYLILFYLLGWVTYLDVSPFQRCFDFSAFSLTPLFLIHRCLPTKEFITSHPELWKAHWVVSVTRDLYSFAYLLHLYDAVVAFHTSRFCLFFFFNK